MLCRYSLYTQFLRKVLFQNLTIFFQLQGGNVVSGPSESAYPIASIIVALWQKFPDFGQLLLSQFHIECHYLIPIYLPEVEGQDKVDHLKSLGYRFNDENQIEDESIYLKRVSGFGRLYFAIMITKSRRNISDPNPFTIEDGWMWLCNILNMGNFHSIIILSINKQ